MQAEAVAIFSRRETVGEDLGEIFRRYAHAIVNDGDTYPVIAVLTRRVMVFSWLSGSSQAYLALLIRFTRIWRTLCFSTVISGDLRLKFPNKLNRMTRQRAGIHQQGVFDQIGYFYSFGHAGKPGVVLLQRHDFFDMVDVFDQQFQLFKHGRLLPGEVFPQLVEKIGQLFALGIARDELAQVRGMFAHQGGDAGDAGHLGILQVIRNHGGGDVDAVDDVANVMEHIAGYVGHARPPRYFEQFPVRFFQFLLGPFSLGNVARNRRHAQNVASPDPLWARPSIRSE